MTEKATRLPATFGDDGLPLTGFVRERTLVGDRPSKRKKTRAPGILGVSAPTLWRWVKEGKFPPPRKLGRITVWPVDEVRGWMAEQK